MNDYSTYVGKTVGTIEQWNGRANKCAHVLETMFCLFQRGDFVGTSVPLCRLSTIINQFYPG